MFFEIKDLNVGYNSKPLISNINMSIEKGEIITLIGPNGSGKSTILKTITKHLKKIKGTIYINKNDIEKISNGEFAKTLSVILTDRVSTEYMTCEDIVGLGRYPHTNNFGKLTDYDRKIVKESLEKVEAIELKDRDFTTLSDGQKQRILLARALCQEPEVIVLDEPTSFLDVHHKIKLLSILRKMAKEKNISVIMSLHEIDLAPKISDKIICVKGDTIEYYGRPEEIFKGEIIEKLYGLESNRYNLLFGSMELPKSNGKPEVFVIAGNGHGVAYYRQLQKMGVAFDTGIIYENDVDYQVAMSLASQIFSAKAFEPINKETYEAVIKSLNNYKYLINAGTKIGEFNKYNQEIIEEAKKRNIKIISTWEDFMCL